jgi:hypothetical protein
MAGFFSTNAPVPAVRHVRKAVRTATLRGSELKPWPE